MSKSDISLNMECEVDELSPVQLAVYERMANEHKALKNALENALSSNEAKELFSGEIFQAYSFKGKVLQEYKEASLPKRKSEVPKGKSGNSRKRASLASLESSDDDLPLAKSKPIEVAQGKNKSRTEAASSQSPKGGKMIKDIKSKAITLENTVTPQRANSKVSEGTSVGGLLIRSDNKETKLQGKLFPSLVVLAKPWLKIQNLPTTRNKLDEKVKLLLMLPPNKLTEWLIREGLLKAVQRCSSHINSELKLSVCSDVSKFPYSGGYVWISECCPTRFVSVFRASIFEGAPHPPSCMLKLIYHWACQTNIQNVVQWVKVDYAYIKSIYTSLRSVCTLVVQQKFKQFGGEGKYVEVGIISFGTTSQDGHKRTLKVEMLGVLDVAEKRIRLRVVEPLNENDSNHMTRFQVIFELLQGWVHKDSIMCIDLTIDKKTLHSMGFKNIIQASMTDNSAIRSNAGVMKYLRNVVPRMFQNTFSMLCSQMIQQFLDELEWREQYGTYALQAFNSITQHISEQTRLNTNLSIKQRLYHVSANPFKDWTVMPHNIKETPQPQTTTTTKLLKKRNVELI